MRAIQKGRCLAREVNTEVQTRRWTYKFSQVFTAQISENIGFEITSIFRFVIKLTILEMFHRNVGESIDFLLLNRDKKKSIERK